MLIANKANSTTSFNIDGNLPWYYAETQADDRMKDILRVGLEAFINQEEEESNLKKNTVSSLPSSNSTLSGPLQENNESSTYFSPNERNESLIIKLDSDGHKNKRSHGPLPESNRYIFNKSSYRKLMDIIAVSW